MGATDAGALAREGVAAAGAIGNPVARARHLGAWAYRCAAVAPDLVPSLTAEMDPADRADLLVLLVSDRLKAGEAVEPHFTAALAGAEALPPDLALRVVNGLSECAIEVAEGDRAAGIALLERLLPALDGLAPPPDSPPGEGAGAAHTLGCALLGEALWMLEDPRGRDLLAAAERGAAALPAPEPVYAFLISALGPRDPTAALRLLPRLEDGPARLDAALVLFRALPPGEDRDRVYGIAVEVARQIAHWRGPEHLVALAEAVWAVDATRGRELFDEALEEARRHPPQMRALQITGVAGAVAPADRDWAERLFAEAVEAAGAEDEPVKRAATLTLIANEMAEPFPREAPAVLERALREAESLTAVWELAHLTDVVFRPDRSPFLDPGAARPLLERMLTLISDDDPRIPGVLAVADVARAMREIAPERAAELYRRWLAAAEAAGDPDGMTAAALALHEIDPTAGHEALGRVKDHLIRRKDCPAMGDFSRRAAPVAPEFVAELAPHIPDRRERADALAEAACGFHRADPERALALLRDLPAADRSLALLRIVDRELDLRDRPLPEPLLEDLP